MLQLLLERGQSYADLASVLGVDEAEVRSRARAALTELAGADPDRNVGLTDYMLGQADPIGRADAVRHLKDDPGDLELATQLSQKLLLVAPQAALPRLPGEERRPRPRRGASASASRLPLPARLRRRPDAGGPPDGAPPGPRTTLTPRQTRLTVVFGCAAVLVVVTVLALVGVFGDSDGESSAGGSATTAASTTPTRNLATVNLQPQTKDNASGTVRFGLENGQQPFIDVSLSGLDPAPSNQTYVIWLLLTPDQGYPLTPIRACGTDVAQPCLSADGGFANLYPIPSSILAVVTRVQFVDVSLAPTGTVRSAIRSAIKSKQLILKRPGTSVLKGAIPKSSRSKGSGGS